MRVFRANSCPLLSLLAVASCALLAGCPTRSPIQKAFQFLYDKQIAEDGRYIDGMDWAGNWPQYFYAKDLPGIRFRDVSPYIPAYIHHALSGVTDASLEALGLTPEDAVKARELRKRTVAFIRRFECVEGDPDAGTFGFWPYDVRPPHNADLRERLVLSMMGGPFLDGVHTPLNVDFFPPQLAKPADADDTAMANAVFLDDALLDGGPGVTQPWERFVADWRDLGQVSLRISPAWLPPASGVFLTWLNYREPPDSTIPNDVDVVVNANVLYALARYGRLDTPGAAETVSLINRVVELGGHRTRYDEIFPYFLNPFPFVYCVTRAYKDGPVPGLKPAVDTLAEEIEGQAISLPDGSACWNSGQPHLDTAFAVLALINAGRSSPLVARAIAYLIGEQDPVRGCWDEGVIFVGRTDTGREIRWVSRSFTTAMVFEALCRYQLSPANPE